MPLLDPLTKLAPSATAAGPAGAQRLDVVWADVQPGSGGTGPLFHKYYLCETGQWFPLDGGWYSRGGEWSSAVTIDAFSDGRVEAFGLGPDGGLQHYSALGDLLNGPGEWIPDQLGTPPGQLIVCSPATTVLSPTQPTAVVRTAEAVTGRLGWWFDSLDALPATPSDPFGFAWTWAPYAQSTSPFWPALNPSFATGPALVWRYNGDFDLFVVNDAYGLEHTAMARDHTLPWQVVTTTDESLLTSSPTATVWRQEDPDSTQMHVVSCYGPFPGEIPVPSAVALKSWLGTRWAEMALIFISEDTETPGGTPTVWSPPTICSWGPPRLDVFFMTTADGFGDGLGITHGWNENADPSAGWGWETFALPS